MKIGIIGGSGLYNAAGFEHKGNIELQTPFGSPSDHYKHYCHSGHEFYFLARHGSGHSTPPHKVNYRANIDGFKQLGVTRIIAFTAVGGINADFEPGDFVVSSNAIDFTSGRESTFFDTGDIYHIDLTLPFCTSLREQILNILDDIDIRFHSKAVYGCTNGPRLETAAEIQYFDQIGVDTVGMTLFPECTLAREREMCYVNISIISNYAAGISKTKLTAEEVVSTVKQSEANIQLILEMLPTALESATYCDCDNALKQNKISK